MIAKTKTDEELYARAVKEIPGRRVPTDDENDEKCKEKEY